MNLLTELENELVQALLVEKTTADKTDKENAIALIKNIKDVLQSDFRTRRVKKEPVRAGKPFNPFSH